ELLRVAIPKPRGAQRERERRRTPNREEPRRHPETEPEHVGQRLRGEVLEHVRKERRLAEEDGRSSRERRRSGLVVTCDRVREKRERRREVSGEEAAERVRIAQTARRPVES